MISEFEYLKQEYCVKFKDLASKLGSGQCGLQDQILSQILTNESKMDSRRRATIHS